MTFEDDDAGEVMQVGGRGGSGVRWEGYKWREALGVSGNGVNVHGKASAIGPSIKLSKHIIFSLCGLDESGTDGRGKSKGS